MLINVIVFVNLVIIIIMIFIIIWEKFVFFWRFLIKLERICWKLNIIYEDCKLYINNYMYIYKKWFI